MAYLLGTFTLLAYTVPDFLAPSSPKIESVVWKRTTFGNLLLFGIYALSSFLRA